MRMAQLSLHPWELLEHPPAVVDQITLDAARRPILTEEVFL